MSRAATYDELQTFARNQQRLWDADQKRVAELELRVLSLARTVKDLTEIVAAHIGAERIAEISGERRVA